MLTNVNDDTTPINVGLNHTHDHLTSICKSVVPKLLGILLAGRNAKQPRHHGGAQRMRNILSGARGMSPVVLVILIAWALLSVVFLTGTLLAARSIDRSVSGVTHRTMPNGKPEKNIYTDVQEIGKEGKFIDEARKTVAISTAIRKAAAPLTGHLATHAGRRAEGHRSEAQVHLGKVGIINATAGEINGTVKQHRLGRRLDLLRRASRSTAT